MTEIVEPILYIIMREDIPDMNPGKGMAQAAHAQANFDHFVDFDTDDEDLKAHVKKWRDNRAFGTTIVLSAPMSEWPHAHSCEASGVVFDHTYPYRNYYGKVYTANTYTCCWVFAYTKEILNYMKTNFELHP